jgi:hypothetical protein
VWGVVRGVGAKAVATRAVMEVVMQLEEVAPMMLSCLNF